jgi:hypothetical protein
MPVTATIPAETDRPEREGRISRLRRAIPRRTRFPRVIKTFQNWHLIYLNRRGLLRTPHVELKTRSGLRITVRSGTSDFRTACSLLVDRSYLHGCPGLPEDAVVVDVGAHIGCFTLLSSQLAPKGKTFSFEPEPANFELLEGNVRSNGLEQVRLFQMAMAESEEERELHYSIKSR